MPSNHESGRTIKAGLLYFALVFGAGFVLGPIRVLWIVPRVGSRWGELIEMPIMLAVILFAAPWVVRRLAVPPTTSSRLGMGCIALGLTLVTEFTVVLWLRGMTITEYVLTRDLISATLYYLLLGLFALLPLFVARK
jgi:hypothetical protein